MVVHCCSPVDIYKKPPPRIAWRGERLSIACHDELHHVPPGACTVVVVVVVVMKSAQRIISCSPRQCFCDRAVFAFSYRVCKQLKTPPKRCLEGCDFWLLRQAGSSHNPPRLVVRVVPVVVVRQSLSAIACYKYLLNQSFECYKTI